MGDLDHELEWRQIQVVLLEQHVICGLGLFIHNSDLLHRDFFIGIFTHETVKHNHFIWMSLFQISSKINIGPLGLRSSRQIFKSRKHVVFPKFEHLPCGPQSSIDLDGISRVIMKPEMDLKIFGVSIFMVRSKYINMGPRCLQ